jgi:hypothetical protein
MAAYALDSAIVGLLYALLPTTAALLGLPQRSGLLAAVFGIFIPIHFLNEIHAALAVFAALCLEILVIIKASISR